MSPFERVLKEAHRRGLWQVLVVFAGGAFGLYSWLERPKSADLLIETEQELRKVSWPTRDESINATGVVILVSVLLTVALLVRRWPRSL